MKEMNDPEGIVSVPFKVNPENSQLELKLKDVAAHQIIKKQASKLMPEVHSHLERYKVTSVKLPPLPSLEKYKGSLDFRLLFSIMCNNVFVRNVISDPIRGGKPWKIIECTDQKTPILMIDKKN